MANFDLIAVDADGTLLSSDMMISEENKRAINYALDKGIHVVLCSGRSIDSLNIFAEETGLKQRERFIITLNGAAVFDSMNNELIHSATLDAKTSLLVIEEIKKQSNSGLNFDLVIHNSDGFTYAENTAGEFARVYEKISKLTLKIVDDIAKDGVDDELGVNKLLLIGENETLGAVEKALNSLNLGNADIFFSSEMLLEIADKRATKGNGLAFVAEKLGISMKRTIAIGDHCNDISMIKAAGLGVAMKGAVDDAKAVADYITEKSNDENGVSEVIYKFIQ